MFRKFSSRSRSKGPSSPSSAMNAADTIGDRDMESVLLHGSLSLHVIEARNVEGTSSSFLSKLERTITSSIDGVDPYCSVKMGYNKVLQTPVVQNSNCPVWNAHGTYQLCHQLQSIDFRVKAAKRSGPLNIISKVTHLSMLSIPAQDLIAQKTISGWFPLCTYRSLTDSEYSENTESDDESDHFQDRHKTEADGQYGDIHISLVFTPVADLPSLSGATIPNTYFPLRERVNVTMYQDADTTPGAIPEIPFNPEYKHGRCWTELANAIMASTGIIYITGWAVWPELVMVRTNHPEDQWKGLTLGEMLKQKAEEGVTVCVMVWDELASNAFYNGIMGTHDEEVVNYFRRSKVHAIKTGRQNPKYGPFADLNDAVMFTHHQKTVILTRTDQDTGKLRVEAWLGGLDLTDGRYDNESHSLFRTIGEGGLHAPPDFWQACATVTAASGPREPWHDIHAHVTGVAAWDVLTNFEGRWMRQASKSKKSALHPHTADTFMQPDEEDGLEEGSWNVQVLRSINSTSTNFMTEREGLIVRKTAPTERSIHSAYIYHIRRAKHFIYIENQYFIGSSHLWDSGQRGGFAPNLVPIEIAEKICAKIRANERFTVYLNIPMYPEGPPDSGAVQEILSHQRKSIGLITTRIANTIQETGSETSISDWFNVFCLVNRESSEGGQGNGGITNTEKQLSETRRFMIYIHSKFAIFDDSIAIIGSANINSRSLDGSRDTEIAISAWQPEHMATGNLGYKNADDEAAEEEEENGDDDDIGELPKGDVAAFRASVWCQHLGEYMEEFENPSSLDCVVKIRELAEHNWQHFASDETELGDMPHGHLALYPYEINEDTGEISSRQTAFPDFPLALVKGRATPGIPNILTT